MHAVLICPKSVPLSEKKAARTDINGVLFGQSGVQGVNLAELLSDSFIPDKATQVALLIDCSDTPENDRDVLQLAFQRLHERFGAMYTISVRTFTANAPCYKSEPVAEAA